MSPLLDSDLDFYPPPPLRFPQADHYSNFPFLANSLSSLCVASNKSAFW